MTMLMGLVSSCSDDGVSELCFVGDSLVAGWDVKASFPTYVVRNDGVSGARVEDILTWNLDYRDKNVVMLIGTNNLGYEFINAVVGGAIPNCRNGSQIVGTTKSASRSRPPGFTLFTSITHY